MLLIIVILLLAAYLAVRFALALRGPPPRMPDALWDDDIPIAPDHPLVPPAIHSAVAPHWAPESQLYRIQTKTNIEWYLFDEDDELIDVFWLE